MEIVKDLHMYSTYSDGKYSYYIMVKKLIKDEYSTFSLTNYNTIYHISVVIDYSHNSNINIKHIATTVLSCKSDGDSDYYGSNNKILVGTFSIDENNLIILLNH